MEKLNWQKKKKKDREKKEIKMCLFAIYEPSFLPGPNLEWGVSCSYWTWLLDIKAWGRLAHSRAHWTASKLVLWACFLGIGPPPKPACLENNKCSTGCGLSWAQLVQGESSRRVHTDK